MPEANGLYYEEHGSGPPLILSAGLGGSGGYWAPNIPALAEHFRVIVYDHRGTGRSDRMLPETVTVETMAEDVAELIRILELGPVHFMGHALGGLIGIELDFRLGIQLSSLIIINGWGNPDPHTIRCFDVRLELLRNSGPGAYIRAQRLFLYPSQWSSDHNAELEAEEALQFEHFQGVQNLEKRIAALRAYREYGGTHDLIVTPTLLIAAKDDILVPPNCSRQLQYAMNAAPPKLQMMEWGGHACNVTDPDTFNRIVLEFLRS